MILDGSTSGLLIGESWGSLSFGSFGLSLLSPEFSSPVPVRSLPRSPEESSSRRPWGCCSGDRSDREPSEWSRWEPLSERVGEMEGLFSRSERVPEWLSWPFPRWESPSRGRVGGVRLSWVEGSPRCGVVGSDEGRSPRSVEVGRSGPREGPPGWEEGFLRCWWGPSKESRKCVS